MKPYAICRHGNRFTVKRTDRNHDLGEIVCERDNLEDARLAARVERLTLERYLENMAKREGFAT